MLFSVHSKQEKGNTHAKWTKRNLVENDKRYSFIHYFFSRISLNPSVSPNFIFLTWDYTYKNPTVLIEDKKTSLELPSKKYSIGQNFKRKFFLFVTLRLYLHSEYLQHHSLQYLPNADNVFKSLQTQFNSTYKSNDSRNNWCTS